MEAGECWIQIFTNKAECRKSEFAYFDLVLCGASWFVGYGICKNKLHVVERISAVLIALYHGTDKLQKKER